MLRSADSRVPSAKVDSGDQLARSETGRPVRNLIAAGAVAFATTIAIFSYWTLHQHAAAIRPLPFTYFREMLLPIAAVHALLLSGSQLVPRFRSLGASLLYWSASALALLAFGGAFRLAAFLAAGSILTSSAIIGRSITRRADPGTDLALSAGIGIACISAIVTLLASLGLFTVSALAGLLAALVVVDLTLFRNEWALRLRHSAARLRTPLSFAGVTAGETAFLLLAFVIVQASAPEQRSDAVRFYLPYTKLLALYGEFPPIPNQWSFVIPQPGLTWAAAFQLLFGGMAARFASPVALAVLVWVIARRATRPVIGLSIAAAVASVPLVLWTSTSLMQESFAALMVVCTAIFLSRETTRLSSPAASFAAGVLVAMTIAAKYLLVVFVAPALAVFIARSLRKGATAGAGGGIVAGIAGGLLTGAPWLLHTMRATGSALFPFVVSREPDALWPAITSANLGQFTLPSTIAGWLTAPLLITFDSDNFVEGFDGTLGVTFLVLLVAAPIAVFLARETAARLFLLCAVIGVASIWTFTAYGRYWLPGQWLLALAAGIALSVVLRPKLEGLVVAGSLAIVLVQLPMAMAISWRDPNGFAWDYFSRRVSYTAYVGRYSGSRVLQKLRRIDPEWPRVWFTGVEQIGHFPVIPMEASVWEFKSWHLVSDSRSAESYIARGNADYWIVNRADPQARYFDQWQVPERYWTRSQLLFAEGDFAVYWLRSSPRAGQAAARLKAMKRPGTLLTRNSSFEKVNEAAAEEWYSAGGVNVSTDNSYEGRSHLAVAGAASAIQRIELSDDISEVELEEYIRCDSPMLVRLQVNWLDEKKITTGTHIDVIRCSSHWTRYSTRAAVSDLARFAEVFLTNHSTEGTSRFDSVSLRAVEPEALEDDGS